MQEIPKGPGAMSFDDFIEVCRGGSLRRIRDALMAGADVNVRNARGMTPLMYFTDKPKITRMLLNAGVDLNAQDNYGETALMMAVCGGYGATDGLEIDYAKVVEMLFKAGADVNIKDIRSGRLLLELVMIYIIWYSHDPEVFKILFDVIDKARTVDVDARDSDGETLLMRYVQHSKPHPDLIRGLIKVGADVNAKGKRGRTALMWVNTPEVTEMLLTAGADVNFTNVDGETPLMYLLENNASSKLNFK